MPQNVGSIEDLISKNIGSRHTEFCKAEQIVVRENVSPLSILFFQLIIICYHSQTQRKEKFDPRINLNHGI